MLQFPPTSAAAPFCSQTQGTDFRTLLLFCTLHGRREGEEGGAAVLVEPVVALPNQLREKAGQEERLPEAASSCGIHRGSPAPSTLDEWPLHSASWMATPDIVYGHCFYIYVYCGPALIVHGILT